MATKTIRIPVIIDANGKWATVWSSAHEEPDWGHIDEMADYENPLVSPQRFWVTAELPLPIVGEVVGAVEEASPS